MDRKVKFREGLSSLYLPFYDRLCSRLSAWNPIENHSWEPYQGYRTFQEQDADYAQGRQGRKGGIITNARGGESPHQYGCATDWTLFDQAGQPLWLKASDPIWIEFAKIVEECGLKSGIHFNDSDHAELWIDCDWKHVLIAFRATNMTGAQQHIQRNMHVAGA